MKIEQVPDNYPTTPKKKRSHKPKTDRRTKDEGMGGWRIRTVAETVTATFIPDACTCMWRPVRYRPGTPWMLKFRNRACPVRKQHG